MYPYFILFYGRKIFHCVEIPSFVYAFISSWTFSPLGYSDNAAMIIHLQIFGRAHIFISPGYVISRSRTAQAYSNSVSPSEELGSLTLMLIPRTQKDKSPLMTYDAKPIQSKVGPQCH